MASHGVICGSLIPLAVSGLLGTPRGPTTSSNNAVTFGGKWQVLPELTGRFDGIIWQGDRRGGRMVDELERMLEIDLWLLRWCKVDGFVRCSVGGAGAAPL